MPSDAQRWRRLAAIAGAVLLAVAVVAIVLAVTGGGPSPRTTAGAGASKAGGPVPALASAFAGIPQRGNALGAADAPGTLTVFADLQCPFCAQFENGTLPAIVKRYVRPGRLRVVFQPIVILGSDSVLGARASASAAQQDRMFDFNATLYRNQGQENSGYLTPAYVRRIATATPGVNVARLMADLKAPPVNRLLNDAQSLATSGHVDSTPSFFVARRGQPLERLEVTSLAPAAFYGKLDEITR